VALALCGRIACRCAGMKKVLQLVFGDARNVASVAIALLAAYGVSRLAPAAAGAALVVFLILAAAVQAGHQK
jgi:hypothetical protein